MKKNLKRGCNTKIWPDLKNKFNYSNIHQCPKIQKIQINRSLGIKAQNPKIRQKSINEFRAITGQHPVITKAKKSISGFKIRKAGDIGLTVTLRRKKMYSFLERLINLDLPRIREFHGLNPKKFDQNGNYNFGIANQTIFPELELESIDQPFGVNITIVTSGKTVPESLYILKKMGLPFCESNSVINE